MQWIEIFPMVLKFLESKKGVMNMILIMLDYMKTTAHANLYYKFGDSGLYSKLSWGQYLAGDEGGTKSLEKV